MDKLKIVYKLYAMELNEDNMKTATKWRFSRGTIAPFPGYILIYTDKEAPNGAIEITEATANRLSEEDESWLLDCNMLILAEETEKRKPEILKELNERVEMLESVLKEKTEETNGGSNDRAESGTE